jgi:hypothetical protein
LEYGGQKKEPKNKVSHLWPKMHCIIYIFGSEDLFHKAGIEGMKYKSTWILGPGKLLAFGPSNKYLSTV